MSTSRITGYVAIVVVAALVLLWQWPSAGRPHRADAQRAGANSSSLQQPEGRSTNANATREPANPGDGKRAGEAEGPARVVGEIVTGEGPAAPARVTVQEDDAAVKQDSEESGPFEVGYEREPGRKYSVEVGAPGMRTVRIPLPTKSENVGKVVLQPALGYHGRLLLDGNSVPGVSVTLRNESGLLVGASAARSDDTGRFEIPIARAEFSRLTDVHGSFLHLTLGFDHSQDVFEGARARVEGFGHGHEIELQPGAKLVFRLSDHAPKVGIRFRRCDQAQLPGQDRRPVFATAKTDSEGRVAVSWDQSIRGAWLDVALSTGHTWYPAIREKAQGLDEVELDTQTIHEVRVRILRNRIPVAGASVQLHLFAGSILPGWFRGRSDKNGEVVIRIGASSGFDSEAVQIFEARVLSMHEGVPSRESFEFVRRGRAPGTAKRLDIRLGRDLGAPDSLWVVCRDARDRHLTPVSVRAVAYNAKGSGLVAGWRPQAVHDELAAMPGLFEVPGMALPAEGGLSDANKGTFLVETLEQGLRQFQVTRADWRRAGSAATPLTFEFPARANLERRLRVVDEKGSVISRAWVVIVPKNLPARFRSQGWGQASVAADGRLGLGHLWPDAKYEIFIYAVGTGRTGHVGSYHPETAPEETNVVLESPCVFEAKLDLDTEQFKNPRGLTIMLVSDPDGALPMVPCTLEGGRIRALRASGLAGYRLQISALMMMGRGLISVTVPASEAHDRSVSFPE